MIKCPKCGFTNRDEDYACGNCGHILKKQKRFNFKIIIPVAVIIIIAVIAVFALTNSPPEKVSHITKNITPVNNTYIASAGSDKFHLPGCQWADKISDENKITYHSRQDAIDDGKTPCGVCNP